MEDYNSQNPVYEGHFKIECLDKNNNIIDDFNKEIMRYLSYCLNCQKMV